MRADAGKTLNWAIAAHLHGEHAEAERAYKAVLVGDRTNPDALHFLGILNAQRQNFPEAERLFKKAIRADSKNPKIFFNFANVLHAMGKADDALATFGVAIHLDPKFSDAYLNRGAVLLQRLQLEDAIRDFDRAIHLAPDLTSAHANRGNALQKLGRLDEAHASYLTATELAPSVHNYYQLANTAWQLNQSGKALAALDNVLCQDRCFPFALGDRLHFKMHLCDWRTFESERIETIAAVRAGSPLVNPFAFLGISASPIDLHRCARDFASHTIPQGAKRDFPPYRPDSRINLAYLSGDFHNHATAHLMSGVFEAHDRAKFSVMALSYGPNQTGPVRNRLEASFEHFIDIRFRSDEDVSLLIRELNIDILVDLKGYTEGGRPRILSQRAAPIQVNYLGYPGTMGAPWMDYILADEIVIPRDHQEHFAEKVVYLPDCYQANDGKREISSDALSRQAAGLPDNAFVFCAFSNTFKIVPEIFDVWMTILKNAENSVLWLLDRNETARNNLRKEAAHRGVSADRLVFAPRIEPDKHLARHQLADLFLDTLPCNAHTTASDALWAGLPVLTCLGTAFPGRVAASLLNAIGLNELIAASIDDYEAAALKIARDPELLRRIRLKLRSNRDLFPLFDTHRFVRNIESAFETMWTRYRQGKAPAPFSVHPSSANTPAGAE